MHKIIGAALLGLVLTGAGCTAPSVPPPTSTSTTEVYRNGTYGFEFYYPVALEFVTPNYANLQDKIAELRINQSDYPKTNFVDAGFSVSASYVKNIDECLKISFPEVSRRFKDKVQINGVDFYTGTSTGAAAGNLYESKAYRTLAGNQTCIELNETVHTARIENFPPGRVTAVDKISVQARLDNIARTFRFIK